MLWRALATTLVTMLIAGGYGYVMSARKRRDLTDMGQIGCDAAFAFGSVFGSVAVYDIARVGIAWMAPYGDQMTNLLFYSFGVVGVVVVVVMARRGGRLLRQRFQQEQLIAEIDSFRRQHS